MDLPKEKKPYRFVIQEHIRGKSSHLDIRFEVNDHLIGFTMDDPGRVGDPLRFRNNAEYSSKHKVLCQAKARQPKEWLKTEGEIGPGEAGATKFLPAKFKILDKGMYEIGVQKPYLLEVFLNGKEYKGRFIFRKLPRREEHEKAGKKPFVWFAWKPIDQNPYVLSARAIKLMWIPPKGRSSLPKVWEDKIPKELKWWEKNWTDERALAAIKSIRQIFLKRNILTLETLKFTLQRVWWKGQKVIRDVPVEKWMFNYSSGISYILDGNPLTQKSGINAIPKTGWKMDFEGDIPPGKPGNPNKKIPAHVEILDKGKLQSIESTPTFASMKIFGTTLKGFWIMKKSDSAWVFSQSQTAPKPKKLSSIALTELQIGSIYKRTLERKLSLQDLANEIGCSKGAVIYLQRKMGLR